MHGARCWDPLAGRRGDETVVRCPDGPGDLRPADVDRFEAVFDVSTSASDRKLLVLVVVDLTPTTMAAYLHCMRAGHAVILLDARFGDAHIARVLDEFRPDTVVCGSAHAKALHDAPAYELRAAFEDTALLRRRRPQPGLTHPLLAVLLATSGSLGPFRFACLTYSGLEHNARAIATALGLGSDDTGALYLSMGYSYGLSVLNSHLAAGGDLTVVRRPPTSVDHWKVFDEGGCTTFAAVPETYRLLAASRHDLTAHPALRLAAQAGGRLAEDLVRQYAGALLDSGREFAVMYGQTEATARIACHKGADVLRHPRSVGGPIPGVTLRIDDGSGRAVPEGQEGQIMVSGPGTMLGYARCREDLGALPGCPIASLPTGDLGRLSVGRLYVTGRMARIAKVHGVRVSLDEMEQFFTAVGPAAVVSDDDERVLVYVEGPVAKYRAARREALTLYGLPPATVRVLQIPAIPRTVSGKVAYGRLPDSRGHSEG
ncbi:AMP-binding protein [Streptomyces canus]|uniref:AMP-binding protein n=1 Tax=Streptomyces canus TaxID=58343 RepID=UPI0030E233CC